MPSNLIDDFLQGIDPIDAATLLAGIRNSVPLGMLFRSGELGPDEMTDLNRRRGPPSAPNPPTIDPVESNRRAQMDFEMQYPDPRIRELLIAEMLKESRNPYSSTTATRRRDFEEAPMSAQQYMSAAPKRKKFNKGGSAKKTLDQMMAEMAQKGTKLADKPDLARRGFLGLGKASDFPLAKMDTKALEKMQSDLKGAPAITEKTVTVDPGKGAAKSTLKSLSETPMSRREVLQSAAGQVMRGVLPDLGGLSAMGNVAKVAETAAAPTALPSSMIAPLLAQAAEQGMKLSDALKFVRSKVPNADELFELEETFRNYKNPSRIDYEDDLLLPSDVMRDLLAAQEKPSIMAARPEMRAMRGLAPKKYEELKDASRDFSMQSIENALGRGVLRGEDEVEMFLRGDPKIWEIIGNR
jgi:hypothetical protein